MFAQCHIPPAKFNGSVSQAIRLRPTSQQAPSPGATTTGVSGVDGGIAVQDIITYAILGLCGFTSLLFVVSVCCTMLVCCAQWVRKGKERRYTDLHTSCFIDS